MAFVPFENTAQVELRFLYDGQHVENVFHVDGPAVWSAVEAEAVMLTFKNWWVGSWQAYSPTTLSLEMITLRPLDSPVAPGWVYVDGLPVAGTETSPQLPNNVTYAVKWSTSFTGRSYRGRTYHLGLCEEQVAGNTLETTYRDHAIAAYAGLITMMIAADVLLVVASRISAGAERFAGLSTPIMSATVDPTVDSQRRRLPGRGA